MPGVNPELLKKYFDGQCTPAEESRVMEWLHSNSNQNDAFDDSVFQGIDKALLKDSIWEEVQPTSKASKPKQGWLSFLKLAASVLIIAVLVHFILQSQFLPSRETGARTKVQYKNIKTALGEKKNITLPDGTILSLNAGSELRVPIPFNDTARIVYLQGEAYLQVTHDLSRPFTVVTEHAEVQVLGTAFNVNAYLDEEYTTVVVSKGKVKLSAGKGNPVLLTKNQLGSYSSVSGKIHRNTVYSTSYSGWKNNELVFRNQPLKDIAKVLERWYAIEVEIKSLSLKEHRFTGKYKEVTLHDLLNDMSQVMQFQYQLDENKLAIY